MANYHLLDGNNSKVCIDEELPEVADDGWVQDERHKNTYHRIIEEKVTLKTPTKIEEE